MDELIEQEEICRQLIELSQTPEQLQYLVGNNTAVLMNKAEQFRMELERSERILKELRAFNNAKEEAYLKAIVELAKGRYSDYD
jgi:hypothetical protein